MKELAQAALTYVRGRASELGFDEAVFSRHETHVHVPAGAIPKDGPSAGVAIATALISLATRQAVRADVAMTGEVTLRGRVLPVGGVREKSLAALRAGITTVILPRRNMQDLEDIPAELKRRLTFVPADRMEDVVEAALEDAPLRERRQTSRTGVVPVPPVAAAERS